MKCDADEESRQDDEEAKQEKRGETDDERKPK
jgi:hypothetical protein